MKEKLIEGRERKYRDSVSPALRCFKPTPKNQYKPRNILNQSRKIIYRKTNQPFILEVDVRKTLLSYTLLEAIPSYLVKKSCLSCSPDSNDRGRLSRKSNGSKKTPFGSFW